MTSAKLVWMSWQMYDKMTTQNSIFFNGSAEARRWLEHHTSRGPEQESSRNGDWEDLERWDFLPTKHWPELLVMSTISRQHKDYTHSHSKSK